MSPKKKQPDDEGATGETPDVDFSTYEESFEKLLQAVQRLENSEASLEEAFEALEAGSQAYRSCHRTLEAARERVEIILRDFPDAEPRRVPFGETGDSGLDDPTDDGS